MLRTCAHVRSMRTHCAYVLYYVRARMRSTAVRKHATYVLRTCYVYYARTTHVLRTPVRSTCTHVRCTCYARMTSVIRPHRECSNTPLGIRKNKSTWKLLKHHFDHWWHNNWKDNSITPHEECFRTGIQDFYEFNKSFIGVYLWHLLFGSPSTY